MSKKVVTLTQPFKPLLCAESTEFFASILRPDSVVFEFGSGGSTLWLAEHVGRLISIEHFRGWYDEVNRCLEEKELDADLRLLPETECAGAILEFPDEFFDVVFVDCLDRIRNDCIANSLDKIKPGGWLVVDDSQWAKLRPGLLLVRDWMRINFLGMRTGRSDGKVVRGQVSFCRKPGDFEEDEFVTRVWRVLGGN